MQKKITIIKFSFQNKGGLEKQALLLLNALLQKNYRITLLTAKPPSLKHPDLCCHILKIPKILTFLKIFTFNYFCKKWIKKNNPEKIFSFERTSFQTIIRAGNGVHKEYLQKRSKNFLQKIYFHLNPLHILLLSIEKKAFQNPLLKKIITNSHMVKQEIVQHYQINPKKIHSIHNPVEWEKYQTHFSSWQKEKPHILKNFNLPQTPHYFLFVGNGYKRKGLLLVLQSLCFIEKDFHLLIVGKDKNIKKYKKIANSLNLFSKTSFFSKRSDILNFYKIADTLILPTYYDPFANVTIEALSMGLFTITSKNNGAAEILNETNGIILKDFKIETLKKALITSLKHPKNKDSYVIRDSVKHLDILKKIPQIIKVINA